MSLPPRRRRRLRPGRVLRCRRPARERPRVEVDLIERLPTPWGLVRLGVAPDHPNIKAVSRAFEQTAPNPGFRFFGNVEVGKDVEHDELARLYDAVVYSVGAQTDRQLGIPGEDLPGSWPATEFVAWYNGHPDFQDLSFDLSGERAVVIGNGNVALDVARMLALTPEELAPTDTTDAAIEAINAAGIREILVVGRRGPVQAAWTPVEVGELGELAGADVIVDPADLELDPASEAELAASAPTVRRSVDHLRDYAAREPDRQAPRDPAALLLLAGGAPRRRARSRRSSSSGTSSWTGARSRPTSARRSRAGSSSAASATRACRSPACRSTSSAATIPNEGGRVEPGALRRRLDQARPERCDRDEQEGRDRDRRAAARGRPGGTAVRTDEGTLEQLLEARGVEAVMYAGWEAIDHAERAAGEPHGRPRIKLCSWDALLAAAKYRRLQGIPRFGDAPARLRPTTETWIRSRSSAFAAAMRGQFTPARGGMTKQASARAASTSAGRTRTT